MINPRFIDQLVTRAQWVKNEVLHGWHSSDPMVLEAMKSIVWELAELADPEPFVVDVTTKGSGV
jgi:hypothetical protein